MLSGRPSLRGPDATAGASSCVYPDGDKIGAYERRADGGGIREVFRRADSVDYYEGEEAPGA